MARSSNSTCFVSTIFFRRSLPALLYLVLATPLTALHAEEHQPEVPWLFRNPEQLPGDPCDLALPRLPEAYISILRQRVKETMAYAIAQGLDQEQVEKWVKDIEIPQQWSFHVHYGDTLLERLHGNIISAPSGMAFVGHIETQHHRSWLLAAVGAESNQHLRETEDGLVALDELTPFTRPLLSDIVMVHILEKPVEKMTFNNVPAAEVVQELAELCDADLVMPAGLMNDYLVTLRLRQASPLQALKYVVRLAPYDLRIEVRENSLREADLIVNPWLLEGISWERLASEMVLRHTGRSPQPHEVFAVIKEDMQELVRHLQGSRMTLVITPNRPNSEK